jgi:competence protein ComEC
MVRGPDGNLVLLGKPSRFVVEQWLRADGDSRNPKDKSLRLGTHCDGAGCVAKTADGRSIALDQDIAAIEEDCRRAAIVITRLKVPPTCGATLILDKASLDTRGATTLSFTPDGIRLKAARQVSETIPWRPVEPKVVQEAAPSGPEPGNEDLLDEWVSNDEPG